MKAMETKKAFIQFKSAGPLMKVLTAVGFVSEPLTNAPLASKKRSTLSLLKAKVKANLANPARILTTHFL